MESQWNDDSFRIIDPVTDSNCYGFLRNEKCLIIDPNDYSQLKPLLQKRNIRSPLVLLTHEHCDHISALNALRKDFDPLVVASCACGEGMKSMKENMSRMMEMFLYYKSGETRFVPYEPFICQPADVLFSEEIRLPFGDSQVWMKSLPGHTHGSSVISWNSMLFVGDYLLPGEKVLTRLPGGSDEEYEACARPWLQNIPDGTWICPGHGERFQMSAEVRQFHDL